MCAMPSPRHTGHMGTRARSRLLVAALGVAALGGVVVLSDGDNGTCSLLARGLATMERPTAAQSWDDIYTLQVDISAGLQLRHELETRCT